MALAAETLGERWNLLIISRLIDGCSRFNEIHRGIPRISPTLLSKRLDELMRAGLVEHRKSTVKAAAHYRLTAAGQDLEHIIDQLAIWGQHWARDMVDDDLEPAFLLWSMHTRLNTSLMPPGRTVLEFNFSGAPGDCQRFWLINDNGSVDMCLKDPGYEVDIRVTSDLRLFIEAWRGIRNLKKEIYMQRIQVTGMSDMIRQFPDWLALSSLASHPRKRQGQEQKLTRVPRQG